MFLFGQSGGGFVSPYTDTNTVCVQTCTITAVTIVITILNGRYIRAKFALTHIEREVETKRTLVGYFSHEIRTPLNSMLMGLQVLRKELHTSDNVNIISQQENLSLVDNIFSSCESAVDILNDILVYQGLDKDEVILVTRSVSVIEFLENKIHKELSHAKEKGVTLAIDLPEAVPSSITSKTTMVTVGKKDIRNAHILIDQDKFGQVIRTLLSNAIQCTPSGSAVEVSITMKPKDKNCNSQWTLFIAVKDNGPDLSVNDLNRMFDNALSFTAGVLQASEGRGLGLWISHRIMRLHNGHLSVTSGGGPDTGTDSIFTIEIPVNNVDGHSQSQRHQQQQQQQQQEDHSVSSIHNNHTAILSFRHMLSMSVADASIHSIYSDINYYMSPIDVVERMDETLPIHSEAEAEAEAEIDAKQKVLIGKYDSKDNEEADKSSRLSRSVESRRRRWGRVLVVDDALMNRKMLCRLLVGICNDMVEAEDGAVAVDVMRTAMTTADGLQYDLVLMDYQMPNMDGPTATKLMRAIGYEGLIIGVTGNTLPIHTDTFISHGANRVLHKPLKLEALIATLLELEREENIG